MMNFGVSLKYAKKFTQIAELREREEDLIYKMEILRKKNGT